MKRSSAYSLLIQQLNDGLHRFDYVLERDFFKEFEESPIKGDADIHVQVELDKRPDMMALQFIVTGTMETPCDRCLETIDLPIQGVHNLIVKFGMGEETDEVIYIDREADELDLAPYLYEYSCLSIPMKKMYNCEEDEEAPCNEEVLNILNQEKASDDSPDSIWDELKEQLPK